MQVAMINDKILPIEKLDPVYLDRGTFFGDGVYEVIRSYDGKLFALDEHIERFANSLAAISIVGVDIGQVRSRVVEAFETAGIADAKIYFHITRGSEMRSHVAHKGIKPNFFLTLTNLEYDLKAKADGICVSTHPDWRWTRCDIKSLNLLANILAREDAAKKGCSEAILVDSNGLVTEGAGSAFFAIIGESLRTAPLTANILPSVTRKFVLLAATNAGLSIVEQSLTTEETIGADELFTAVTTQDIVPVVKFDNNVIGDGKPGKYTKRLIEEFRSFRK